ncbi:MAG TPA: protein kinase [Anaeromyxobacter sp.]|nr:protein kinase [Anaeromyxobacter sp.]
MAPAERAPNDPSQAMSALLLELARLPARRAAWERELAPGETVGRFELVRELGRGGFGIVYEARDRELGRSVAFKAVRPGRPLEAGAGELLLREAEAIARLSHPNLVTLHDVGRCEQGPYLVLELLRGATLAERLGRSALPVAEALRIGAEVARGLAHAHAAGVTHRDLKPSNVFLCEGGHVKVLDFGMAHAFGRQRTMGGTPAYMAPEQWRDGAEDGRTDLFALGVMLYQMVKGEVPLAEGGRTLEARPAPRLEVAECPALGALVARLLARDPADRARSAGEVLAALEALRDALRTGEDSTARLSALDRPGRRARRAGFAAAAAAVAAGVAAWLLVARPVGSPDRPSVAVLPFAALSTGRDDASLAAGIHAELITQLAQVEGLRIAGRSSVQEWAPARARDLRAVGRALGVTAVVEGTLQRRGDRVRIQVHLVDPATGAQRWAEGFDHRADDLFALQSEVAVQIAHALGARLTAAEQARVERAPTRDPVAHQLYLKALYFWGRSSDDADRERAHGLLEAAVARDPGFALARAWLAVVSTELANAGHAQFPFAHTCEGAREQAGRALELDPDLPQAHGALAEVRWACDGDDAGALAAYELQARMAPGDAVARVNVGYTRMALGQWRAAAEDLRAALALDPRSYFVAMLVADRMLQLRRFDDAEQACRRAQELSPGDVRAPTACALVPFFRTGDLGPARAALDAMVQQWNTSNAATASAVDLLVLLPERTLDLAGDGRLPDPISLRTPFIPRAVLTGMAHQALGHAAAARADLERVVRPLEEAVEALRRQGDRSGLAIQLLWLARAEVGAGRAAEAMAHAAEARSLIGDAAMRTYALFDEAEIAAHAGERDRAVALLAELLDAPGGTHTAASLRASAALAPLRGYEPFERLATAKVAGR